MGEGQAGCSCPLKQGWVAYDLHIMASTVGKLSPVCLRVAGKTTLDIYYNCG